MGLLFCVISFWTLPGLGYLYVGKYRDGLILLGSYLAIGVFVILLVIVSIENFDDIVIPFMSLNIITNIEIADQGIWDMAIELDWYLYILLVVYGMIQLIHIIYLIRKNQVV